MDHRWRQNVRDQASTLGRKLVSVNDIIKKSVVGRRRYGRREWSSFNEEMEVIRIQLIQM